MGATMTPPARIEDLLAHADWLRRLATHVARGADADELIQDTWIAALRSPPDGDRPPRPWLAEVLRNFARRRGNVEQRRRSAEVASPGLVPSAEEILERAEAQRILAELVVALPEPYRGTVMLRYYDGLSSAAIAAAQGVPAGTVRWRLKEALDRLRAGLDARYRDDRNWALVLVPPSAAPSFTGVVLAAAKTKLALVAAALAVLALVGAGALWYGAARDHGGGHGHGPGNTSQPTPPPKTFGQRTATSAAPGTLEGFVHLPDGQPAPGAMVALIVATDYDQMEDKTALRPRATVVSAANGGFRFTNASPGSYLLTATASDWAPGELGPLQLEGGKAIRGLELTLAAGGARIHGTIWDAGSGPIAQAAVRALALSAGARPEGARTFVVIADQRGEYRLRLPPGGFRLVADADGYSPAAVEVWTAVEQRRDFRLAPAARVSGRVVHHGQPVAAARVHFDRQGAGPATAITVTTDATGAFLAGSLPGGQYDVWGRSGALVGRGPQLTVVPGGAAELVIELARGAVVAGFIRDPAGRPVPQARLRVKKDFGETIADAAGRFRLEGLPPGRHTLSAEAKGHGRAEHAVVVGNSYVEGVVLVLPPEARVHGRVWDRRGQPVAGASVFVGEDLVPELSMNVGMARTDQTGWFEVGGLAPGRLRVEAEHPTAGRGIAGPVQVQAGAVHEVDVVAGRGVVRGRVSWQDGAPAAGVVVRGAVRGRRNVRVVSDRAGAFELGPFTPGEVHVNAWPETDALGGDPGTAKVVQLAPGEGVTGVHIAITRRDERIDGRVIDPDGHPLPAAAVGVAPEHQGVSDRPFHKERSAHAEATYSVLSDGTGAFSLQFLPRGRYTLWATHPDYPEANAYGVPSGSEGVQLRFVRGATLAGRAVDRSGSPVPTFTIQAELSWQNDATPLLRASRGLMQQSINVQDPAGAFAINHLHGAVYDLLLTTPDHRVGRLTGVALATGEARRGLRVVVDEGVRLEGRLVDETTGQAVGGVWLGCSIPGVRAGTDATGAFVLVGVPPGRVDLYLPGRVGSLQGRREVVLVPERVREHDLGTLRISRGRE